MHGRNKYVLAIQYLQLEAWNHNYWGVKKGKVKKGSIVKAKLGLIGPL